MQTVTVSASAPYAVHIGSGLLDNAGELVRAVTKSRRCALVTDSTVGPLYAGRVLASLEQAGFSAVTYAFPAGEEKRLRLRYGASMEELCRRLLEPLGERARSAVEGAALARLRGELRRRRMKNDLLLAAAETAGELLGLEPTRRYTMEEFNAALGERIQVERGKNGERDLTPDTLPREGAGLGEALGGLKKLF